MTSLVEVSSYEEPLVVRLYDEALQQVNRGYMIFIHVLLLSFPVSALVWSMEIMANIYLVYFFIGTVAAYFFHMRLAWMYKNEVQPALDKYAEERARRAGLWE